MLRSGGTLLVTVPCISRVVPRYGLESDFWRFTPASCRKLFGDAFGATQVTVEPVGNDARTRAQGTECGESSTSIHQSRGQSTPTSA